MITPRRLTTWLHTHGHVWQMDLLDAGGLESFAGKRGIDIASTQVVTQLWQLGLLRADLVLSPEPSDLEGFTFVDQGANGAHIYADERLPPRREQGWIDALKDVQPFPNDLKPSFHPFRLFVLNEVDRVLQLRVPRAQPLLDRSGIDRILNWQLPALADWTATAELAERVTYWNDLAALAIAAEPVSYERIFGHFRYPPFAKLRDFEAELEQHAAELGQYVATTPLSDLTHGYRSLCTAAHFLDPNDDVHRLLRLADGSLRLELEGRLGGAIILLTMAEMVRRITERAHDTELPEEDEEEGGYLVAAKEQTLGARRIFDGDRAPAIELVRRYRLDYTVRVRWYVEGPTEFGAIRSIFPATKPTGVEVLNLRGQVYAGRGALAFRDELEADVRNAVYSFISIDGDVRDNAKVVRAAARQDRLCGAFFIPSVDFESANFTRRQLVAIAWRWALEQGAPRGRQRSLRRELTLHPPEKGGDVIERVGRFLKLPALRKSEEWGERLARLALAHPVRRRRRRRPFVDAIEMAARCQIANYPLTRGSFRVDEKTGQPVRRSPPPARA